jgi:CheY-like chemotaxis protein
VNLLEAFTFPVKIMRDVQTQVMISVAPVSPEICSHIITDKQWLLENLLCLLSNAVRYSQAGTVDVRVMIDGVSFKATDFAIPQYLRFEVWDTGIGLTENAMTTLFAPFKQAQRLAGGTGLGLFSLAKRVEALHGDYGVSARPDGILGSLFWFTIPYRTDAMSAAAAIAPRADADGATFDAARVKSPEVGSVRVRSYWEVLVVDDAPSILKMTTMLLTKKGHHVEQAVNGAVALEKVTATFSGRESRHYDVVLMDLQMPVMDGVEAIRRIRAAERATTASSAASGHDLESGRKMQCEEAKQRRQMIIALSANSDSDTMQDALDAGADYFMSKPFTYEGFCDLMTTTKRIN